MRESTGIEEQAGLTELSEEAGMAEMRELHVYDCALMGAFPMRLILATMLVAGRLLATLMAAPSPRAERETCPPICDQIPATAWISTHAVPLNSQYRWPAMAGAAVAVTRATPRFGFEQVCATPAFPHDSRDWAVAGRVTVVHPDGQWQLQAQVLHWRGDTARGGQIAASVFGTAVAALRACQLGAPLQSPSVTDDEPTRMAAVISGPVIMHTYLVAHVSSSTISELTLWSSGPPQVPWPTVADSAVLDALTAPLCEAYIGSCP
ncbi:ATPase [Mycobacterium tuberculosis]|uniref:ATPase n=1 Tax=Mycobacterium tuberculosis TaxID=1773 RepID=UPI001F20620E|nr:ATPase [Mycobacterium tuberculosis]